jgi:hypothetical protein
MRYLINNFIKTIFINKNCFILENFYSYCFKNFNKKPLKIFKWFFIKSYLIKNLFLNKFKIMRIFSKKDKIIFKFI